MNPFQSRNPAIASNPLIRTPQQETHAALAAFAGNPSEEREVGIVLPVGCGKSGCITLAPFAFRSKRTLVVAPGLKIAEQLYKDFDPTRPDMFYIRCGVLQGLPYPEPVEIRGTNTNRGDLDESHVVITNIQQLQGQENRWLANLPADYFDLILFDEGHHSVAETYESLKAKFPAARIVNFSATPLRADGQKMAGRVLYSYPIFARERFDYMLANPPFGVEWKPDADEIVKEHETKGMDGRFGAGLPRINDGSLLFLQHMLSKMKPAKEGGTRIGIIFNGSPLFTGDAGSGESEIRRWILENDWLDVIVALPDQLFYNTGIFTYLWILTNRKRPERRGKKGKSR